MRALSTKSVQSAGLQPRTSQLHLRTASCSSAAASSATQMAFSGLNKQQVEQFNENGFLALPGFASKEQVAAMMQRCREMVDAWDPQLEARRFSVFTTKEEQSHAKVGLWAPCVHRPYLPAGPSSSYCFLAEQAVSNVTGMCVTFF